MDELSAGSLYLVVLGTLALALAFKRVLRGKETGVKLPPGPWNLPIIGSLHHLVGAHLPHRALLRVSRRQGPLMLLRLGEVPAVVVSSPEAAMEFLRTRDPVFASRPRGALRSTSSASAVKGSSWRHTASTGGRCARSAWWSCSAQGRCSGWSLSGRRRGGVPPRRGHRHDIACYSQHRHDPDASGAQ